MASHWVFYPRLLLTLAAALWTLVLGLSLGVNVSTEHEQARGQALLAARAYYDKDLSYRLWATKHGGAYVPVTGETPPNPYLAHVPERDLTTPSGKRLTLMNPAYMLRQVMGDFNELYGVKGHITSLQLMNPINAPDAWERKQLQSFRTGDEEVAEEVAVDGVDYLRYMRPMVAKEGCLKCHGAQGYKVGDIRGGVSLSVPMAPFRAQEWVDIQIHAYTHLLFWLVGLAGLFFFWRELKRFLAQRAKGEEERERLIAGIEQSADAVIMTDRSGAITYVNPAFVSLTGYTPEDALGNTPRLLKSGRQGGEFYERLWQTITAGGTWHGAFTNRRKDGSLFQDETTISPTFDASGEIVSFVAVKRDVSREQRLQRARDYFTAVTSHELRTPLSKIKLLLLLLAREGEAREERRGGTPKMLEVTESLYDDLDWIMRQTGTISEINLSWQNKRHEPFYLYLAVDECIRRAREEVKRHHRQVTLQVSLDEAFRETMATGSERLIGAALDNLLSNGVKYTPDGRGVELEGRVANGRVRIMVRDEGPGMSREAIAEALVPYFSGEELGHHATGAFRYQGGGLGLGLTIVKMVMEYHGGELIIEDAAEGKGTTAILSFPVSR